LVLNKIDQIPNHKLLPLAAELQEIGQFEAVFMISASLGHGCDKLRTELTKYIPEGAFLYEEDALMDIPQRLWAAEITREQALLLMHDEIPYGLHVETTAWEQQGDDVRIAQTIIVANDRHKGMVIGKAGAKIKEIGTRARATLIAEMDGKVHLDLEVKTGDGEKLALQQIEAAQD
jgi:GTP-binding protein Era